MDTKTLINLANENGLAFRGGFTVIADDNVPEQLGGEPSQSLLMFGQVGNSLWPVFSHSSELADQQPHPLDRWSERVGQTIAIKLNGRLLLPFGSAPHHPFLRWASRIEDVQPSRFGMLIHPVHGLWHAYRFAIALPDPFESLSSVERRDSICDRCEAQPCLKTCPVDAFDGVRYDVETCFNYLQGNPESVCNSLGCQARDACPEGKQSHYDVEQKLFHMNQFTLALQKRFTKVIDS